MSDKSKYIICAIFEEYTITSLIIDRKTKCIMWDKWNNDANSIALGVFIYKCTFKYNTSTGIIIYQVLTFWLMAKYKNLQQGELQVYHMNQGGY